MNQMHVGDCVKMIVIKFCCFGNNDSWLIDVGIYL